MKNLTIDVGNTRTKIVVFEQNQIVHQETLPYLTIPFLKKLSYNHKKANCILTVTGNMTADIEKYLRQKFKKYLRLSHETPMPVENLYKTPQTLGRDRLAAVIGAQTIFPKENCLVIDAGTCITFDVLNAEGQYLGGNISPGIEMRMRAMHEFTAKLPLVDLADQQIWIGEDTTTALRNGGQLGALLEVRGFITKCRRKFGHINVVFTGGNADFFVKQLKSKIFARPNLVPLGLNQILHYNFASK